MKVGVAGFGIIGGSVAKAYTKAGHQVYAYDKDSSILAYGKLAGACCGTLTEENISECDLIFICVYPKAALDFIENNASLFKKGCTVIDCCGVKQIVCEKAFPLAEEHGFTFVGGHPMAGSHKSGFGASRADLFKNASMVIVPHRFDDMALLTKIKKLLAPLELGTIKISTAKRHDRMIAYTSQLSHILSNALVQSPSAADADGFSGGSYRDLTRVGHLNEKLWAELFLCNKDALLSELDIFISALEDYRSALASGDKEKLEDIMRAQTTDCQEDNTHEDN